MRRRRDLTWLRDEIRQTDEEILSLIARRIALAREVGEVKMRAGLPIQDFQVEKRVLDRNRRRAHDLRLPAEIAEEVTRTLINFSVVAQDEDQRRARSSKTHTQSDSVLILGGCGGMGRWLSSYFDSFGYPVTVFDPRSAADPPPYPVAQDLERAMRSHAIVVLATPIGATAQVLRRVIRTRTEALVFDICSLKSPLLRTIRDGLSKGLRIASIHPMFGPAATVLAGRNIVFCDTGKRDHSQDVRRLFEPTTARLISVPLQRHDRVMGYVLGLSHMVSLVFGRALATGGISAAELGSFSSTTFTAQARVSGGVAAENPDLYFDIQAENAATPAVLAGFRAALVEFQEAVADRDRSRFKALMESARQFFSEQQAAR